jgi:hypothetical protein
MLKRDITYTTFDGEEITEEFHFHISKIEILELETRFEGGLQAMLRRVMTTKDTKMILEEFKRIILLSVGRKSTDGRRFLKTDEIREEFEQSPAFEVLFMDFLEKENYAADFLIGVLPADVAKAAENAPQKLAPPKLQPAENIER